MLHLIQSVFDKCREQALRYGVGTFLVLCDYLFARCRYGFCGEDYFLNSSGYAMKNFRKADFFSHKRWLKARLVFNDSHYTDILQNKVKTLEHLASFTYHGWCYPKQHGFDAFKAFVERYNAVICKPISEEGGVGITLYNQSDDLRKDYERFKKDDILLEECIVQHPKMSFNNRSVNTVRVYSILDGAGNVHILKAILRAGVGDTVVDNFHSGGVIYPLDVERGFVESYGERRNGKEKVYVHPGTEINMLGFQIPRWESLKNRVVDMARHIPEVRYIGWDMVVTPDGIDFIEANDTADHALFGRVGVERLFWNRIKSLM